jgi:hypothetical protein
MRPHFHNDGSLAGDILCDLQQTTSGLVGIDRKSSDLLTPRPSFRAVIGNADVDGIVAVPGHEGQWCRKDGCRRRRADGVARS